MLRSVCLSVSPSVPFSDSVPFARWRNARWRQHGMPPNAISGWPVVSTRDTQFVSGATLIASAARRGVDVEMPITMGVPVRGLHAPTVHDVCAWLVCWDGRRSCGMIQLTPPGTWCMPDHQPGTSSISSSHRRSVQTLLCQCCDRPSVRLSVRLSDPRPSSTTVHFAAVVTTEH